MEKKVKGIGSRRQVMNGTALKTKGNLTKKDLQRKDGRIISKKKSSNAKKNKSLTAWASAMKAARKELGITEFQLMKKGSKLYKKTKEIYDKKK